MRTLFRYETEGGKVPFDEWIESLEIEAQAKIDVYLRRLAKGGSRKNIKPLGQGLLELKIDSGPGYRCYFALEGERGLLLLLGGTKRSQQRDIEKARFYWRTYGKTKRKI